jgi:hypothetical protein
MRVSLFYNRLVAGGTRRYNAVVVVIQMIANHCTKAQFTKNKHKYK